MTRNELLHMLVGQARAHGFDFRRWFTENTGTPWTSYASAIDWLTISKRAHMLLFSHGFAQRFFQSGGRITYVVPPQTFERVTTSGKRQTVHRKAHIRHSSRDDVWRFHLREMAAAAEPLRYIRRFLVTEETLQDIAEVEQNDAFEPDDPNYDDENLVQDGE